MLGIPTTTDSRLPLIIGQPSLSRKLSVLCFGSWFHLSWTFCGKKSPPTLEQWRPFHQVAEPGQRLQCHRQEDSRQKCEIGLPKTWNQSLFSSSPECFVRQIGVTLQAFVLHCPIAILSLHVNMETLRLLHELAYTVIS